MAVQTKLTGGSFLFEQANVADIFIPEEFTEEQLMISASVKDFNLLKSIQRFTLSRDLKNEVNELILKFFSELAKTFGDRKLTKEVMSKYYNYLLPYKNDVEKNSIIGTLDILKWIEDELQDRKALHLR